MMKNETLLILALCVPCLVGSVRASPAVCDVCCQAQDNLAALAQALEDVDHEILLVIIEIGRIEQQADDVRSRTVVHLQVPVEERDDAWAIKLLLLDFEMAALIGAYTDAHQEHRSLIGQRAAIVHAIDVWTAIAENCEASHEP
jgi:hypothetical protein